MLHPGALGDVLLAVPALRTLRRAAPGVPLRLAAQPRIGTLLARLGLVDESLAFDGLGLEALFVEDRATPTVEAIERAGRVVCWFGARDEVFVRRLRALAPEAVVASPIPAGGRAVWQHLLASVGGEEEASCEPAAVPDRLEEEGRRALMDAGWDGTAPLVVVHPGAGGVAKRWPAEGFARVLAALVEHRGVGIVVHEGPADREAVAQLLARLAGSPILLRDPPLPSLAGALRLARGYLGNDCGVSHLAAAVGVPSLVLFAAANLAWRPWCAAARPLVVATPSLERRDVEAVMAAAGQLVG